MLVCLSVHFVVKVPFCVSVTSMSRNCILFSVDVSFVNCNEGEMLFKVVWNVLIASSDGNMANMSSTYPFPSLHVGRM